MKNLGLGSCVLAVLMVAMPAFAQSPAAKWYKGNTHSHSLWSDGRNLPEQVADWYKSEGYNFLVLSDHDVLQQADRWKDITVANQQQDLLAKAAKRFGQNWSATQPARQPSTNPAWPAVDVKLKKLDEIKSYLEEEGKFILIQGYELSDKSQGLPLHMNAVNFHAARVAPSKGTSIQKAMAADLAALKEAASRQEQAMLVHINHPNFNWALTAEDLAGCDARFVEVLNGHPGVNNWGSGWRISVERMWDIANSLRLKEGRPPLLGMGTDDSHSLPTSDGKGALPGRAWIMVRARSLAAGDLVAAMNAGDYYFSTGVTLEDVQYDLAAGTFSVSVQAQEGQEYMIAFIGTMEDAPLTSTPATMPAATAPADGASTKPASPPQGRLTRVYSDQVGKVLQETKAVKASYKLTGKELFVRAVITSNKPAAINAKKFQQAFCQPFGWEKWTKQ